VQFTLDENLGRASAAVLLGGAGVIADGDGDGRTETMGRAVTVQWVKGMKIEGSVGPHRLVMDAPAEAGGGDEAPSPAELLLGAIGA
jgi:hypothetical protein